MRTGSSIVVVAFILAMLNGCSSVKPAHPVSINQGSMNVSSKYFDKNVVFVEILTRDETAHPKRVPMVSANSTLIAEMEDPGPFTSVWAIKAKEPVSAKNLQITPGTVPSSFQQIIPRELEEFKPVKGREYYVVISLEPVGDSFYSMGSKWTLGN
jgi:hypothetical protein